METTALPCVCGGAHAGANEKCELCVAMCCCERKYKVKYSI